MNCTVQEKQTYLTIVFFMFCFILLVYSNTFLVPFHFDDLDMIQGRTELHLSSITPDQIFDTFFLETKNTKRLYRPLSSFSFALNYYFGQYNLPGYHLVNILIHSVTAFVLYLTILLMLNILNTDNWEDKKNIAGLATLLWAVHPINIQAVTYIVQRMASLAAMFYIIGIWSYLKFKNQSSKNHWGKFKFLILSLLSFFCATLSKENAAIFPLCILFIEFFLFDGYKKVKKHPQYSFLIFAIPILLIFISTVLFYDIKWLDSFISGYDFRPFDLKQRVLTESRVVLFYISQLLYPIPSRFSIEHYFVLSETIINPISTLLCIIIIIFLIVIAFCLHKKNSLIGFSILFYFIHHIIESTIWPLELVFEHRNYLPSLFFFLPVSIGIFKGINFYKKRSHTLHYLFTIFTTMLIFLFGMSTYIRNSEWGTSKSLWESASKRAPLSTRPYNNLGYLYDGTKIGNAGLDLYYFNKGLNKNATYSIFEKAILWLNIAKKNNNIKNFQIAEKAVLSALDSIFILADNKPALLNAERTKNFFSDCYFMLSQIYLNSDIEKSLLNIEKALYFKKDPKFYNEKAIILIHKRKYENALESLHNALNTDQNFINAESFLFETYFLIGNVLTLLDHYEKSLWFYKLALSNLRHTDGQQAYAKLYFHLADNRYLAGKTDSGDQYIKMAIRIMPLYDVLQYLNSNEYNDVPFINKENLMQNSKKILKLAFNNS